FPRKLNGFDFFVGDEARVGDGRLNRDSSLDDSGHAARDRVAGAQIDRLAVATDTRRGLGSGGTNHSSGDQDGRCAGGTTYGEGALLLRRLRLLLRGRRGWFAVNDSTGDSFAKRTAVAARLRIPNETACLIFGL